MRLYRWRMHCLCHARAHQVNAGAYIHGWPAWLSLANDQVYGDQNADNIRPACQNWIDMAAIWLRSLA